MTHLPIESESCQTLSDAAKQMEAHSVHQLPVLRGSRLIGLISQVDLLEARLRHGPDYAAVPVDTVCRKEVLQVGPMTPVNEVAAQMLEYASHCAVVVDGGFVVGVFTATDALQVLATR